MLRCFKEKRSIIDGHLVLAGGMLSDQIIHHLNRFVFHSIQE